MAHSEGTLGDCLFELAFQYHLFLFQGVLDVLVSSLLELVLQLSTHLGHIEGIGILAPFTVLLLVFFKLLLQTGFGFSDFLDLLFRHMKLVKLTFLLGTVHHAQ